MHYEIFLVSSRAPCQSVDHFQLSHGGNGANTSSVRRDRGETSLIYTKFHTSKPWGSYRGASSQWLTPRNVIDTTRQAGILVLDTLSSPFYPSTLQIESPASPMGDKASPRFGPRALSVLEWIEMEVSSRARMDSGNDVEQRSRVQALCTRTHYGQQLNRTRMLYA